MHAQGNAYPAPSVAHPSCVDSPDAPTLLPARTPNTSQRRILELRKTSRNTNMAEETAWPSPMGGGKAAHPIRRQGRAERRSHRSDLRVRARPRQ